MTGTEAVRVDGTAAVTDAVLVVDDVTLRFGGVTSIDDLSLAQPLPKQRREERAIAAGSPAEVPADETVIAAYLGTS